MSEAVKWIAPDISCQHCAMAVKRALAAVGGISQVAVDVPGKVVAFVAADQGSVARARAALEEIGYPPASA